MGPWIRIVVGAAGLGAGLEWMASHGDPLGWRVFPGFYLVCALALVLILLVGLNILERSARIKSK